MKKATLAIDIDDVIADSTDALRIIVNEATGLHLTIDDYKLPANYWGYYEHVWTQAGITDHSHIHRFHEQMAVNQDNIEPIRGAVEGVQTLSENHKLFAVTSRELFMEIETHRWMQKHFPGMFQDIILLGDVKSALQTKGEACLAIGAHLLIDDNIAHCESALAVGVGAVLYGDHGWQHNYAGTMPWKKTWPEVSEYIDGLPAA